SSSRSKGSILGDKTRMPKLANNPKAYIRPSASSGSLGGVARKTRESILLCEAAGYDIVIIETVGVGQSETSVHSMVDFFLLLMLAGAGDELQGMKKGIMEMADAIAINKADGDNIKAAENAAKEYKRALHLFPPKEYNWTSEVLTCSSIENKGLENIWEIITGFEMQMKKSGWWSKNRSEQNKFWLHDSIRQLLLDKFYRDPEKQKALLTLEDEVMKGKLSPFEAAKKISNS
ncbi:MAG: methylmalonyl Co-A mutase-associated GTPase MeaB, partial [Chitinophagales bacterium]